METEVDEVKESVDKVEEKLQIRQAVVEITVHHVEEQTSR